MRILLMTDLEGVAGVSTPTVDTSLEGRGYAQATRLLTEEVNAAVRGFCRAGATAVTVFDGHGPGAIDFDVLQPPARLVHGRPLPPIVRLLKDLALEHDLIANVGQHAMSGVSAGNLNHTQNSREVISYELNGRPIGEIAQFALLMGELGLPWIFLSGDAEACCEAETLQPGIVTAAVKTGLGRTSALTLTAAASRQLIETQAEAALRRQLQKPFVPLCWPGPYVLQKTLLHTEIADTLAATSGARRVDAHTVEWCGETLADIIYS